MNRLFSPIRIGNMDLPQRFVMAPLTRNRAGEGMVPTDLTAEYYAQRAGAGLIVTEGSQPSAVGQGYLNTPGIHTPEQVRGWAVVADRVHEEGGHIFIQLMHSGRIAHPDNKQGLESIAPSAIAAPGEVVTANGMLPFTMPRALETDEIPGVIEDYVHASRCAIEAGLDGVEIHAANGYLLHQFLSPASNHREGEYGGSPENRARLTIETVKAVADAIGAERVGIRISPAHNIQGVLEKDPEDVRQTYEALLDGIAGLSLAYLSILADPAAELTVNLRARFDGPIMTNSGFAEITTKDSAAGIIAGGEGDLVAVGRPFLANPDLAERWRTDAPLNEPQQETFYGGGAEGYTDYPRLEVA
ncbi:MAG: alkene reductase [Propionibacteriaceae bacterium]|nr:alkene reductase [Propionibacteriaceae bacterium]